MIPEKLRKRRVQAAENKVKAKHRSGVTPVFPVRLTSCIFTRPVTRITSHPGSKTMRRKEEEKLLKPRQLYESRRLQDYQVEDSKGEQLGPLDLTNSRRIPPGRWTQAVQSGANDLHTSRGFSSVQPPHSEQVRGTPVLPPPLSFYSQGETRPLFLRLSTFSQEQVNEVRRGEEEGEQDEETGDEDEIKSIRA
ncbi:hypothetical protein STEG23_018297 [Scotinomys teguina]